MILLQRKGNIHQLSGRNVMLRTALTVTSSRQTLSVKGIPLIDCQVLTVGYDRSRQIYDKLTGWQYYLNLLLTIVTEKNLRQWNLAAEKLTQVFFFLSWWLIISSQTFWKLIFHSFVKRIRSSKFVFHNFRWKVNHLKGTVSH